MGKVGKIIRRLEELFGEARAANELRYSQGIGELEAGQARVRELGEQAFGQMSFPETLGQTARSRLQRETTERKAEGHQDLISRGLYNTTLTATSDRLLDRQMEEGMQDIDASVDMARATHAGNLANLLAGQAGMESGMAGLLGAFIEGRHDEYPDLSQWLSIMANLGQVAGAGAAPGGAGGGGFSFSQNRPPGFDQDSAGASAGGGVTEGAKTVGPGVGKGWNRGKGGWPDRIRMIPATGGGRFTGPDGSQMSIPAQALKDAGYKQWFGEWVRK